MPAQESDPPVGAGPDNPSGRMPENSRRGDPQPPLVSLPPWGEGRERGPPYFPPQGILIPSSPMLLTGDSYGGSRETDS